MNNMFSLNLSIKLWFNVLIVIFMVSCTGLVKPQEQGEETGNVPTTIKPIPTLNIGQKATLEAKEQFVQELMRTNGKCKLPCWWGIELGESLENTEATMNSYGIRSWNVSDSDFGEGGERGYVISGYYNPDTFGYNVGISVDFHTVDSRVQFIDVLVERPLHQYGEEEFVRDWEKYAVSSMLQQYGKPPYVYLIPQNEADSSPANFILVLYYPDTGFKFSYQPYTVFPGETKTEFCLNLENIRQINLSLYNPRFVGVWANYLQPPALNPKAETYFEQLTWEAQTGMDLNMFYEIFKASNSPECVQITQ